MVGFSEIYIRKILSILNVVKTNWQSIFLIALCSWILIAQTYRGANSGQIHEDFQTFYDAGARLNHGEQLYDWKNWKVADSLHFARHTYDYTPTVALLARPFAIFSADTAYKLWFVSQILFLFGAVILFAVYAEFSASDAVSILLCLITGLHYWPTVCTFDVGQVNFLMLLLIVGVMLCQKQQQFCKMSVLIGVLACVKYWALGLTAFLVFQRKWLSAGIAVGTFLGITALQFSFIGWSEFSNFLIVGGKTVSQTNKALPSQSVFGLSRMLFSETAFSKPLVFENDSLSQACSLTLCVALAALMYAVLLKSPSADKAGKLAKYAFAVQTTLLMLPACHIVYFIFSLPVLWTLFAIPPKNRPRRYFLFSALGMALYLCGMHWSLPSDGLLTLGFFYWSVLLWLISLGFALSSNTSRTLVAP